MHFRNKINDSKINNFVKVVPERLYYSNVNLRFKEYVFFCFYFALCR